MRIVVSSPTFLPIRGGAEVGIHEIYKRLARENDVTILTRRALTHELADYGAQTSSDDRYNVVRFRSFWHRMKEGRIRKLLTMLGLDYSFVLARQIVWARPDVVNLQFVRPHLLPAILAKVCRVPVVLSLVGRSDVLESTSPPVRLHARTTIALCDAVIQNSEYYTRFEKLRTPVFTIPYGVPLSLYNDNVDREAVRTRLGISASDRILISVQRLTEVKRVDLVIEGFVRLCDEQDDLILIVVGKGPEREVLEAQVARLGLERRVLFVGYQNDQDLADLLSASDLFISHSMVETFGVVFAEAMAAGLPVVAADTSCVRMVVTDACGSFFPPGDLERMCELVKYYLRPENRRSVGRANRARAHRDFDWEMIAEQTESVMRDIASRSASR